MVNGEAMNVMGKFVMLGKHSHFKIITSYNAMYVPYFTVEETSRNWRRILQKTCVGTCNMLPPLALVVQYSSANYHQPRSKTLKTFHCEILENQLF